MVNMLSPLSVTQCNSSIYSRDILSITSLIRFTVTLSFACDMMGRPTIVLSNLVFSVFGTIIIRLWLGQPVDGQHFGIDNCLNKLNAIPRLRHNANVSN